jgi:cytochrome c553
MRRWTFAALAAWAGAAILAAQAASSSRVAWTVQTIRLVRGGDAARGQKLHKDCADCHGAAGNVDTPEVPDIGGQSVLYIFKQLQDYKAKTRTSDVMNDAVASLSDRDMADLAAFYAAQKPPARRGSASAPPAPIEKLVSVGDGARLLPACDACHGDRGAGSPQFYGMPWLQNQKPIDLAAELKAFRSGERGNDVYRVMRDVARRLTDAEITALAGYYSGAPPDTAAAAPTSQPIENPAGVGKK